MTVVASFLEGSILTWAIPLGLLVVIGIYWAVVVRKHPEEY